MLTTLITILCIIAFAILYLMIQATIKTKIERNYQQKRIDYFAEQWSKVVKALIKKQPLYNIKLHWHKLPKCSMCDEDRHVSVYLPDGTKQLVSCTCDKYQTDYEIQEISKNINFILCKDGSVALGYSEDEFRVYYKIKTLDEAKEYMKQYSNNAGELCFTKKTDAEQFLKWYLKQKENKK